MKAKIIITLILTLAAMLFVNTVFVSAADSEPERIQPKDFGPMGWVYADWNEVPTIPKERWVSFVLPVNDDSKEYYFKFYSTDKKGYKCRLRATREKDPKDTGIYSTPVCVYKEYGEVDTMGQIVHSGENGYINGYLKPGWKHWVGIWKDDRIRDPIETHMKIKIEEIPMNPSKGKIASVTAKKKGFAVKLKKSEYATKYELAYKTGSGKWEYAYTQRLNKAISKLKSKRKYRIKARAIRIVEGKDYIGRWSAVKKVKTR